MLGAIVRAQAAAARAHSLDSVVDCRGVNVLRLRFPDNQRDDLVLDQGVHALGRDTAGGLSPVEGGDPLLQVCVDRRGAWLQVREGVQGLHLNGRPVRRMAMLRPGDALHLDGSELAILGEQPAPAPPASETVAAPAPRHMVLRGIGGKHHGRCFSLDHPCVVGRDVAADVRITDPAFAGQHARLEPHADGVVLRDLGSADGTLVNGHRVQDGLLRAGSQVVFGAGHRFILEAPLTEGVAHAATAESAEVAADEELPVPEPARVPRAWRRMPWLLVAALLLAGALALLLMYGTR